jgi:hypothetical protein
MFDTAGNLIQAHQPHIYFEKSDFFAAAARYPAEDGKVVTRTKGQAEELASGAGTSPGTYYLYGSSHVGASAGSKGVVHLYTSPDLHAWTFRGGVYNHSGDARPSLLGRHPSTGLYVMWFKGCGSSGNSSTRRGSFQSATAPTLLGPFEQVGCYFPEPSCTSGDSAAFLDPVTGGAFMTYSQHTCQGKNARAMKVLRLDDATWTSPAAGAAGAPVPTVAGHLEAPCPFYSPLTKQWFIWTSHTSGWDPNPAALLVSSTGMGGADWSSLGNPSMNKTTFSTQGSNILRLPTQPNATGAASGDVAQVEHYLYLADRYEPYITGTEGSRYIFLALEVHSNGTVVLKPPVPWSVENWPRASLVAPSAARTVVWSNRSWL